MLIDTMVNTVPEIKGTRSRCKLCGKNKIIYRDITIAGETFRVCKACDAEADKPIERTCNRCGRVFASFNGFRSCKKCRDYAKYSKNKL